jgi:hypothetical protein
MPARGREGTVRTQASAERVKLFIDYLYLHFIVENIPERINGCSGRARTGIKGVRTTEGG